MSSDASNTTSTAAVDGCSDLTASVKQGGAGGGGSTTTVHILTSNEGGAAGNGACCDDTANNVSIDSNEYVQIDTSTAAATAAIADGSVVASSLKSVGNQDQSATADTSASATAMAVDQVNGQDLEQLETGKKSRARKSAAGTRAATSTANKGTRAAAQKSAMKGGIKAPVQAAVKQINSVVKEAVTAALQNVQSSKGKGLATNNNNSSSKKNVQVVKSLPGYIAKVTPQARQQVHKVVKAFTPLNRVSTIPNSLQISRTQPQQSQRQQSSRLYNNSSMPQQQKVSGRLYGS